MNRWLLGVFVSSAVLASPAFAGDKDSIYVPGTTSECCIGEGGTNSEGGTVPELPSYWGQSFVALGKRIRQFEFYARDLNGPLFGPLKFHVLLVDGELNSPGTRTVLFESDLVTVSFVQNGGLFRTISVDMKCAKLAVGHHYTWIVDAYSARDGIIDVGQVYVTSFQDTGYSDGQLYTRFASGLGRVADLNSSWDVTPIDMAFYATFYNDDNAPADMNVDFDSTSTARGSCRTN